MWRHGRLQVGLSVGIIKYIIGIFSRLDTFSYAWGIKIFNNISNSVALLSA